MTLEAEPPFEALFAAEDPFAWAASVPGEIFREAGGRRTVRIDVDGRSWFLKTHTAPTFGERLKEWSSLRRPTGGARDEVRALRTLEAAGLRVPHVAAWAERGSHSIVVTADIGTQVTLGTLLAGADARLRDGRVRRAVIEALATTIGRMHAAGVNHRDCYLVHVPVFALEPDRVELGLMDLHRAGVRTSVPPRWRAKDLGGLLFSAEEAVLTRGERARFRVAYARAAGLDREAGPWRRVERRAARLAAERERRGARFGR